MNIKKQQSGFTLIELVVVIVILGILAATAIPKFIDLSDEAAQAAVEGVAGAMSSAMAINYAGCAAVANASAKCTTVADCDDVDAILQGGAPDGYTIGGAFPACTVTSDDDATKVGNFTAIAVTAI